MKETGLSYNPEEFYDAQIKFYNFGWRDHQTTGNRTILKILKNMDLCLKDGKKVAVHCHAGRGRTGIIICAYMIYKLGFTAEKAIEHFRFLRKPSLGKSSQRKSIQDFEKCKLSALIPFRFDPRQKSFSF